MTDKIIENAWYKTIGSNFKVNKFLKVKNVEGGRVYFLERVTQDNVFESFESYFKQYGEYQSTTMANPFTSLEEISTSDFDLIHKLKKESEGTPLTVNKWFKATWNACKGFIYIKPTRVENGFAICTGPNSIWAHRDYSIYENGTYNIKGLSNITLLTDLSEIQEYLPSGHPDKIAIPEYVECIFSKGLGIRVGKIYAWPYPVDDAGVIRKINDLSGSIFKFKPSTKEAYDIQTSKICQYVKCETLEEWNYVSGKLGRTADVPFKQFGDSISLINPGCSSFAIENNNTKVYSFAEWCKEYGYLGLMPKSLVGRYLKALVDKPESTDYRKGEYAKIIKDKNGIDVHLERYSFDATTNKTDVWELMPEGFEPIKSEEWVPKVGDWAVITTLNSQKKGIISGTIGHVFKISSISGDWHKCTKETHCKGSTWPLDCIRAALLHEIPESHTIPVSESKSTNRVIKLFTKEVKNVDSITKSFVPLVLIKKQLKTIN